ncbi:glycosyltransferase family 1 protein [Cellulomonas fimi]|uniref:Glycosyltransferase family 4 protein n=1 Tax=Cellulomonas fimi TaxID=1708 RepID=A0A7Y0QJ16_CELFI|nr:glycosyltransferase family 1 protein [Cellulomonas fimi]NMR20867.1 glycosyltransferase family 4 protein [Cellulomonas fimi]
MTGTQDGLARFRQRLAAAADVMFDAPLEPRSGLADEAGNLLRALVDRTRSTLDRRYAWLLHTAVVGHLPLIEDVEELVRRLELARSSTDAEVWLLQRARELTAELGAPERELRVVSDGVVVDVNYSAQNDRHTGIQRVTREVCARWDAEHDITLTAWLPGGTALRGLLPHEEARVLRFTHVGMRTEQRGDRLPVRDAPLTPMVVPWRSTVVLPEVAQGSSSRHLAALARFSGNEVAAVGYDAIPITLSDLRPGTEPNVFTGYLTLLKHIDRVAAISRSAATEFRGFSEAVRAQGLEGPVVSEVMLAAEVPDAPATHTVAPLESAGSVPRMLCVGSHELHKNHLAVLHAAELLWREGLEFTLTFVGGSGWDMAGFDVRLNRLAEAGRPVRMLGAVTDDELWAAYREATFTVFPSFHEGFGLPVAESLACGTPAVTTGYGSTAEIAERGGCLLVDPRDDHSLARALRTMLTDPRAYRELKEQAVRSVGRSWDTYSAELWDRLVDGKGEAA